MRGIRLVPLIAGLALVLAAPAAAQAPQPIPALAPVVFESWQPAALYSDSRPPITGGSVAPRNRTRRSLIGGAIGATAGVVFCTVISTLADDSADGGVSFCPADSYLLIGGGGFVLGAAVGWLI